MNPAEAHLALNHLPVVGALLMVVLLAWGLARRSRDLVRAALWITVALTVGSYVAVATGEKAEEFVEEAAWFDEGIVDNHEKLGELALKLMLATGLLALIGLWALRGQEDMKRLWPTITLAALVGSTGLLGWTAALGGQIRHEEIRPASHSVGLEAASDATDREDDDSTDHANSD